MPGTEGVPPTSEEISQLREKALAALAALGQDNILSADIAKLTRSDKYVSRFFMHVFDLPGSQIDEASNMILETFKWRKKFGVDGISADTTNQSFFEKGTVYSHNRDKDGKKLLVFVVGRHTKGSEKMEDMKKFFVYYLERLEREELEDEITIVFDCRNAGLKNMDMEFMQFIIGMLKDYYPWMVNYILVFEMPWVLNAAWKVIKAWLPAAAVKKIKFLTKSNMGEYITDDNRLEAWGGSDPWEYEWEPERLHPDPAAAQHTTVNGAGDDSQLPPYDDGRKKTVTFANAERDVRPSPSLDSFTSYSSSSSANPDILKLNPSQEVIFSGGGSGELVAKVQLTNISDKKIGFKIKTTSPEKYRVRPSSGTLKQGQDVAVELHVSGQGAPVTLVRDKFLVTVIFIQEEDVNNARLQELLKSTKPEAQYRLRCQLLSENGTVSKPQLSQLSTSSPPGDINKQMTVLLKKVNQLSERNENLENQLTNNFRIQVVLLVLTFILVLLVWIYLPATPTHCLEAELKSEPSPVSNPSQEL